MKALFYLLAATILPFVFGFTFSFGTTSLAECGTVDVNWQGGSPPFSLSIIVSYLRDFEQALLTR